MSVSITGDVALLAGTVTTLAPREATERAATGTRLVSFPVDNRIAIESRRT